MNDSQLLFLRAATIRAKRIPGSVLGLDLIRRLFFKVGRTVRVTTFDGDLSLDLRLDEHMQSQIFWYGSYSRDILIVLKRLLEAGMVVVDAGANIGEITLVAAKKVGTSGKVYAFEPLPEIADQLERNVRLNKFGHVAVMRCGLSDESGDKPIYRASSQFLDGSQHEGLATLYPSDKRSSVTGHIQLTTLDEFVRREKLERLDLIKMDIEGAELPALRGSVEVLRGFQPYIVVEVQEGTTGSAGYQATDILAFLESLGYRFSCIRRMGRLSPVTRSTLGRFQNILCSPTQRN